MKVMMYSANREGMLEIARRYGQIKEVTIMGEHRNDKWIAEISDEPKARRKKVSWEIYVQELQVINSSEGLSEKFSRHGFVLRKLLINN